MIKFINAGAGSGKTFALSQELSEFLIKKDGLPSQVILTTFTKKSAEELKERVRVSLLDKGHPDKAADMANALIGTVNAVCSQLVEKYAFEMGLSPELKVMDETSTKIFFDEFISNSVDAEIFHQLNRACSRFDLFETREGSSNQKDTLRPSWPLIVKNLAARFRSYNLTQDDVERSKDQTLKLAADVLQTKPKFSVKKIWAELEESESEIVEEPIGVKDKIVIEEIDRLRKKAQNKERVSWLSFCKAGGALTKKGRISNPWLEDLTAACASFYRTTEFGAEYQQLISLLYDTAFSLIKSYQEYKQEGD